MSHRSNLHSQSSDHALDRRVVPEESLSVSAISRVAIPPGHKAVGGVYVPVSRGVIAPPMRVFETF
jgi:hypothetical protein